MTVIELIKELQTYPAEYEVVVTQDGLRVRWQTEINLRTRSNTEFQETTENKIRKIFNENLTISVTQAAKMADVSYATARKYLRKIR